jgi:hypothetical protein
MLYIDALNEDTRDFIPFAMEEVSLRQKFIDDVLTYFKVDI